MKIFQKNRQKQNNSTKNQKTEENYKSSLLQNNIFLLFREMNDEGGVQSTPDFMRKGKIQNITNSFHFYAVNSRNGCLRH
jgi:hypothetical protein